ncbi:MAG TPA: hypothetical protein VNW52_05425, partial [Burkholderiaceae bacterium]|nr:hypothetical protein [Burkholderiaceae bacterium]
MGSHFPALAHGNFWNGIYHLMFQHNPIANEFRTYGLSKLFHFGLYGIFGSAILPYYFVMAAMSAATAVCAAIAIRSVTGSLAVAIAVASCCLLGPFMLFETFHHATYLLLPLFFTTAYWALDCQIALGQKRKIAGAILCALIVMTGEISACILLAALGLMVLSALYRRDKARLAILLIDFLVALSVLGFLFGYYRVAIYNPNLSTRFATDIPLTPHSIWLAL